MGGRRPLRFLAWKLGLSDDQFQALAAILSDLKTARAAAGVERRRASAAYADAVRTGTLDADKSAAASQHHAAADQTIREAVAATIAAIHALLDDEQRAAFSLLLREAPPWMM